MKTKSKQLLFHLAILIIVVGMDLFGDYYYNGIEALLNNFKAPYNWGSAIIYTGIFTVYTLNFYLVCPLTLGKKNYLKFGIGVLMLIVCFAGVRYFLEEIVLFHYTGKHNYFDASRKFFFYTFDNSYFAIKGVLYSTLLYIFFEYSANQKRIHDLELNYKKAELSLLKSQIEPHFLFNTLNTFYTELIDVQPETAKDIHRLSELLRYVTYEADNALMPLKTEIKFIEDYIYLHRKRFEDTLFLDYDVIGKVDLQQIPSMVLIHFVENIFKHGSTNQREYPASIRIQILSEGLVMETHNKVSASEKYSTTGIGFQNLRRRLTAIYGADYDLTCDENENDFKTILRIPFKY